MQCKKCGGTNFAFQMMQSGGKSGHKGNGFGGHMNNTARAVTAVSTLGMSNLLWKKSKGGSKTKFKNETVGVCQNCGHSVKV